MIIVPQKTDSQTSSNEKVIKVVYCLYRVSTKNQVEENDIPMQKLACHQFAESHFGWVIRKEFYEFGVSGYNVPSENRDQLQLLKSSAERHEFDVLLVFMFDRLGRRDVETPFVLRWCYENGIEVWSVKEGQKTFNSSTDDLLNYMYFWAAKNESLKTSMRVRTKLRQMVSEGKYTGGIPPFGYCLTASKEFNHKGRRIQKLKVIPEEARVVRMIFDYTVMDELGTHVIAKKINLMGIKTHKGSMFQSITINRILKNPIYCGYYYRAGILSPKIEELQIVDDSVYNEVQRIINCRTSSYKESKLFHKSNDLHLLQDIAFCGYCGEKMYPTSNNYRYTTLDGVVHEYIRYRYICAGRAMFRSNCRGQGSFTAKYIDQAVSDYITECIEKIKSENSNAIVRNRYEKSLNSLYRKIHNREIKREDIALRIKALYGQVADSLMGKCKFTPDILSEAILSEKESLDSIEKEITAFKMESKDVSTLEKSVALRFEKFRRLLFKYEESDLSDKRTILKKLINKVTVLKNDYSANAYKVDIELNEWCSDLI